MGIEIEYPLWYASSGGSLFRDTGVLTTHLSSRPTSVHVPACYQKSAEKSIVALQRQYDSSFFSIGKKYNTLDSFSNVNFMFFLIFSVFCWLLWSWL